MKATDILVTAIRNSFRSRLRTSLTVIAIFIGAFTLTLTNGLGAGINNYIDSQIASIGAPDVMNVTKPIEVAAQNDGPKPYTENAPAELSSAAGPPGTRVQAITADDLATLGSVARVISVVPVVNLRPDYIEHGSDGKFQLNVSPLSAGVRIELAAGQLFDPGTTKHQIILPTTYIDTLGFTSNDEAVGQTVTIGITNARGEQSTVDATVIGVQEPTLFGSAPRLGGPLTTALYDAANVGIPADTAAQYTSATVTFAANATAADITALTSDLAAAGYAGTTVADQIGTFQAVIDGIILVLNAFAVIALLAAGFGIINTLLMSVQERTREIGLMKAMGMSGGRIFALFSTEAVFIGFLGSAIGAAVAIIVGGVVSGVLAGGLLKDLAGLQILTFTPVAVITVLLLVMAIAFIAAVLPASRAARPSPIDSLRYE